MVIDTVHAESYHYMEELGKLVEEEHPEALPDGQKFLLASIGMEFGKPFEPDDKLKAILEEASQVGAAMLRANMWDYPGDDKWIYADRKWWNPFVGSQSEGIRQNDDGSTDIYFSPAPPEGYENNWLETVAGKGWFVALRIYGPLEPWIEKQWRPSEIELVA